MTDNNKFQPFRMKQLWQLATAEQGGRLKTNAAWSVLGNLMYGMGRIVVIILLTKYFASDQVGEVMYALAIVTPLSFLLNLEMRSVYITDTHNKIDLGYCLSTRFVTIIIYLFVLFGFAFGMQSVWGTHRVIILALAGLVRGAESWVDLYLGVFQKHERMKRWAVSQICKTSLVIVWVMTMSLWTTNIYWMFVGWFIVTSTMGWFYDRHFASQLVSVKFKWSKSHSRYLFRKGMPLGIFVTMAILNHQVAQYFIEHNLDASAVAYFGVLAMYVSAMATLQNGINQAVLSRLASYNVEHRKKFWQMIGKIMALTWGCVSLALIIVYFQGQNILYYLHAPEYAQYHQLFLLMIFAGGIILTGMILGDAIIACHHFKSRMIIMAIGLATNMFVCWRYIAEYGIQAAVWASLASSIVIVLVCIAVLGANQFRQQNKKEVSME